MHQSETIEAPDGRRLALHQLVDGDRNKAVLFCHPVPGSGHLVPNEDETLKRRVSLYAIDRAGYAASDPLPPGHSASLDHAAADVAHVIKTVSEHPIGVLGWSAGGLVAAALAANHPECVDRLVLVGTPAPNDQGVCLPDALGQSLGLSPTPHADALDMPPASSIETYDIKTLTNMMLGVSDADVASDNYADIERKLEAMVQHGMLQGTAAIRQEIQGFYLNTLDINADAIQAKTLVLNGSKDPFAAHRQATWWKGHLPNARLEMVPNAGHLLIFKVWKRALSHLAPQQRGAS